ncbi:MAG: hypothetical protein NWE77_08085 [Candidatus Bathyarchaeota archaeon]|jgi:hypothetical protein|nr:hypothetical protein [Candidatus Bathyarchaeota archaeon]
MSDRLSVNALETLREEIRKMMNEWSDHLSSGGCKDFAEYTHGTGVIKGLALAERELLDLNKRIEGD